MTTLLSMLLAAAVLGFIAYPFFRRATPAGQPLEEDKMRELGSYRDTTYSMIKELEFDYQSGFLGQEDYQELQSRYKKKAVEILKEMDEAKGESLEDEVERQVSALRGVQRPAQAAGSPAGAGPVGNAPGSAAAKAPSSGRARPAPAARGAFCTDCGAKVNAGDRFCTACGRALKGGRNAR